MADTVKGKEMLFYLMAAVPAPSYIPSLCSIEYGGFGVEGHNITNIAPGLIVSIMNTPATSLIICSGLLHCQWCLL